MSNNMNKQTIYVDGLFFNKPHENAPDFVIGSLAVSVERFNEWINNQEADDKGFVRIDILEGKERPYCKLNTYKGKGSTEKKNEVQELNLEESPELNLEEIPVVQPVSSLKSDEVPVAQPASSLKSDEEELDINSVPF
jgi:hypothetical protein